MPLTCASMSSFHGRHTILTKRRGSIPHNARLVGAGWNSIFQPARKQNAPGSTTARVSMCPLAGTQVLCPRFLLDPLPPFLAEPLRLPRNCGFVAAVAEIDQIEGNGVGSFGIDFHDLADRSVELSFWRCGVEHADAPNAALVMTARHVDRDGVPNLQTRFVNGVGHRGLLLPRLLAGPRGPGVDMCGL